MNKATVNGNVMSGMFFRTATVPREADTHVTYTVGATREIRST